MDDLVMQAGLGALVAGLMEATKRAVGPRFDWSRWGAWVAILLGVGAAEAAIYWSWFPDVAKVTLGQGVFVGLMVGLTASGVNRLLSKSDPQIIVQGPVQEGAPATVSVSRGDVEANTTAERADRDSPPALPPRT